MSEASTKPNASLPYGMVLILLFKEFKIVIFDEESKNPLRHTDIYNIQTLYRMRYKKKNGHWERKGVEPRIVEQKELSREATKASPEFSTRLTSLAWDQPAPSFIGHMDDNQMRRMAGFLTDELISRGHTLVDHSIFARLFESFKIELARVFERLISFKHNQSSLLQDLLREMKDITIRLSMIEASKKQDINSIKERLEDSTHRLETLSSGDS